MTTFTQYYLMLEEKPEDLFLLLKQLSVGWAVALGD